MIFDMMPNPDRMKTTGIAKPNAPSQPTAVPLEITAEPNPKPVDQLSEQEKFAIARKAGVPVKESRWIPGPGVSFKLVLYPAAITIVDGKYMVAWRKDD